MIPLYFPFTYVGKATAARLRGWFDRVALLVPSADLAAECLAPTVDPGFWQVTPPPPGDETALKLLEEDLRRWADVHAGSDLAAVLANRDEQSPFSTVPPVNRLRNQIQAGIKAARGPAAEADPLLTARVFLRLAHGLDRDRAAIQAQLADLAGIETEMLSQLRGQPDDVSSLPPAAGNGEDAGAFLTQRRLAAWAHLALAAGALPEVWVTDSRAVIETLGEILGVLRPVWALETTAAQALDRTAGSRLLAEALTGAGTGPASVPSDRCDPSMPSDGTIVVYAADLTPEALCRRLAAGARPPDNLGVSAGRCRVVRIGAATVSPAAGETA